MLDEHKEKNLTPDWLEALIFWNKMCICPCAWSWLTLFTAGGKQNGYSSRSIGRGGPEYDSCSSFMSSELESTSCFDSEDDDATSRSDVLCNCLACSLSSVPREKRHFALRNASAITYDGFGQGLAQSNCLVVFVVTPSSSPPGVVVKSPTHFRDAAALSL